MLLTASLTACATHPAPPQVIRYNSVPHYTVHSNHHAPHWRQHNGRWVWVIPTIIGGVIGYEIARQQPSPVHQPVIVEQITCSEWREVQDSNGRIYRERTCQR
jgi:hypothetical protein